MAAKLTDKQKIFCKEYIVDFNGTRAAIAAGYSEKTANRIASENLSKLDIQDEIARLTAKRNENLEISAERVLKEFSKIAFAAEDNLEGWTQLDMKDKIKALENVGKILGAYNNDESGKNIIKVKISK